MDARLDMATVDLEIALAKYRKCNPKSKEALDKEAADKWSNMAKYNSYTSPYFRK